MLEGYNEIPQAEYFGFTLEWMREAYRILKPSGSMYVFSGWNNLRDILNALENVLALRLCPNTISSPCAVFKRGNWGERGLSAEG